MTTTANPPHRVVVVGHGMVAARFLDELDRRLGPSAGSVATVTVLAEEVHAPYNRLLLSEVLAGRADLGGIGLPDAPAWVDVRRGTPAERLDLAAGAVVDALGLSHPFDTLVLATGAAARVPSIAGLADETVTEGELPPGAWALRTLDDCRELLAAVHRPGVNAVVLGGGLLGLEAACGLRQRGAAVTVVHAGAHVMDRQLDEDSGSVVSATMADLGIVVATGTTAATVRRDASGRVRAVELTDGRVLPCDILLLTAGIVPRGSLASQAGLPIDRGIIVDEQLRSPADARVAAIGDCAQTAAGCPGLLAPGWEQAGAVAASVAAQVASHVTEAVGQTPFPTPSAETTSSGPPDDRSVVRLKAVGLDVVTMGRLPMVDADVPRGAEGPSDAADLVRVVSLTDRRGRRSVTVGVRDGRVVGARCVGAGQVAADLTVAFERGTIVPADPAHLLVSGLAAAAPPQTPARMPASATVCRCNGVSKGDVVSAYSACAAAGGAADVDEIAASTRASTGCGGCRDVLSGIVEWMRSVEPPTAGGEGVSTAGRVGRSTSREPAQKVRSGLV